MFIIFCQSWILDCHWCRTFDYIDQIPSAFWNALFEFHRGICDQTIETSVLLTKVEELFEDQVQPLIGKLRKWGCDAPPTFKYWDMFLVAIQIMLSNVRAEREGDWSHIWCLHQTCSPLSSLLTVQMTLDGCLYIYLICSNFQPRYNQLLKKASFSLDKHPAVLMVIGAIWTLKKHHIRFEGLRWYHRNNESEICPC